MKISPLPELDLARIAPMTRDQQYHQLRQISFGHPPYVLNPFRRSILDILNATAGPLALSTAPTPFEEITANIRRWATSEVEAKANLQVAEGLRDFATAQGIRGRREQFLALQLDRFPVEITHIRCGGKSCGIRSR